MEFCGGTHVVDTGKLVDFVVVEESGIAKGVRRLVAVTGDEAVEAREEARSFGKKLK